MFKAKVIRQVKEMTTGMPALELEIETPDVSPEETGTPTEQMAKDAYEQAYREGERAGYEMGLKKADILIGKLKEAIEDIQNYRKTLRQSLQPMVFSMSMAIARAILKEEITARVELMKGLIEEAVRRVEPAGTLQIRLHPNLKEVVESYKKELEGLREGVKIEIDPSLKEDSVVVSTPDQEVPLDMDTLIKNLVEQLKDRTLEDGSRNTDRGD